jgi:hypothetical protein
LNRLGASESIGPTTLRLISGKDYGYLIRAGLY